ncbi:MAG: NUDIX hydrolase [Pseudomonadales bacterium]|nr:NUDIX hydrolase [Pseudomonadales bacterium]
MNDTKVEHKDQPIRPAATVIIVRDAQPQYEIFMLRRTNQAAFAGGMYVFPGGRVDDHDHSTDYSPLHRPPLDAQQLQRDALGEDWRAYWIAGIRETFEESGFLLAYDNQGKIIEFNDDNQSRFDQYREQIHSGDISLLDICQTENLTLAIDLIHFYNRWITPLGRPRRFDTRFFITQAPGVQSGQHDGHETVDSIWISPDKALEMHASKELGLMGVTEKQLRTFAKHNTAQDFLQMAAGNDEFPTFRPVLPGK